MTLFQFKFSYFSFFLFPCSRHQSAPTGVVSSLGPQLRPIRSTRGKMENKISNAAVPARASRRRKAPAPFRSHRPVAPPQVSPTANVAAVLSATRGVTVVGVGRTARPPLAVPLASAPQACAWSDGGECLVVGDSAGALHFVDAATGAALLSQPLVRSPRSIDLACDAPAQHIRGLSLPLALHVGREALRCAGSG